MAKDREELFGAVLEDLNAAIFDGNSVLLASTNGNSTFVRILASDDDEIDIILIATFAAICEKKNRDPYKLALLCAAFASRAKTAGAIERIDVNHDTIRN